MGDRSKWDPPRMPTLQISRVARVLARQADASFREIGIRAGQFPVLLALKQHGRLTQRDLAKLAAVEQPTMAQILGRMERDGLISREPDESDGRISQVSLTVAATNKVGPAREILRKGNEEALEALSDAEVDTLIGLLDRVIATLGSRP